MSPFQLPSSSASAASTPALRSSYSGDGDDEDDEDNLPYPAELQRNDFLANDFDPQTYLSTLRNRHQTLEDLRSDLRQRSQLLNKELLDLVNGHYEDFLSLGSDLKGGEEKVEGVRVGLLGFRREVEGIRKGVKGRADEVGSLMEEKKAIRRQVMLGRNLLEVDEKINELEESLGVDRANTEELDLEDDDEDDEDDDEYDSLAEVAQLPRLRNHTQQYVLITNMINRIGVEHPFLATQHDRMEALRKTLLLDLAAALRQANSAHAAVASLEIVKLYNDIDARKEAVKVLKGG